ncbi:MAG: formylglycine-generating enzyme family protein [Bacteroidales bacterium]|nr:formylglycine-generating enzyme family protein [Bacteroidales bacterium]
MTHVSGDVGKNISAGKGKRIVWDVLQDCDKLQGDRVCFSVTATRGGDNQTITVNGVSFTMVYVEGGTFTMGCTAEQGGGCDSDEYPSHSVTLSGYYIGETEVTQALWKAVMGSNPSNWKGDQLPVESVSWDDCQTFISKLNSLTGRTFRLPTEAEWEYAARGGKRSKGYKYSGSNNIDDVAWYGGNSGSKTHAVKGKRANELGLYDMSGNVWEWCSDWKGEYSSGSQRNPKGPSSGSLRVYRGGSKIAYARSCRVSYRNSNNPSSRGDNIGFRLALVP